MTDKQTLKVIKNPFKKAICILAMREWRWFQKKIGVNKMERPPYKIALMHDHILRLEEEIDQLKKENDELKNFHINLVGVKECEIKELFKLKADNEMLLKDNKALCERIVKLAEEIENQRTAVREYERRWLSLMGY